MEEVTHSDITYSYDYGTSKKGMSVRPEMKGNEYRKCHEPWTSIYIDVEGWAHPCTDNLDVQLGSIYEKTARKMYGSGVMAEFRKATIKGWVGNCREGSAWAPGPCPMVERYMEKAK